MNHELGHANLLKQTIEAEGLQIKIHLPLVSKVNRLTKITSIIYFHEIKVIKPIGLSNQFPIETLTVFHIKKINCSQVALDKGFNFR